MPRYYRRRYTRVIKPKKKWASNIKVWNNDALTGRAALLVSNSVQTTSPTPSIIKTGNFKISADLMFQLASGITGNWNSACIGYILYVPEGWGTSAANFDDLVIKHPEWIMATKTMGNSVVPSTTSIFNVESINMSTRLKRNLNSGDSVVFYIRVNLPEGVQDISSINITGTCRYWTCTN